MNLLRSDTLSPALSAGEGRGPIDIYHLHPLVAGPIDTWPAIFARIVAMGFTRVCLAPPFEAGNGGDIFLHATFDRLHPALHFNGSADQGLALMAELASRAGLRLMLDIAPGQIAIDSPLRQQQPNWFTLPGNGRIADPRRPPLPVGVAVPRFGQKASADAVSEWWVELLTRWTGAGVAGFRCLTLDLVPVPFWRRLIAAFPEALFLAWTPGVADPRKFAEAGFDLTCSSPGWWDGHAPWFVEEQAALRDLAPALVSPEPSFLDGRVCFCRWASNMPRAAGSMRRAPAPPTCKPPSGRPQPTCRMTSQPPYG